MSTLNAASPDILATGNMSDRTDRVAVYIGELLCAMMLVVTFIQYQNDEPKQSLEHAFATSSCSLYLLGSVLIDLSIKNSPMYFDPAALVFLVEFGKLIFSLALWVTTRDVNAKVLMTNDVPPFLASA